MAWGHGKHEMKNFTLKLPVDAIAKLDEVAEEQNLATRTMVRSWILERLPEPGVKQ